MFSTRLKTFLPFSSNLKLSSANSIILGDSRICHLGKGKMRFSLKFCCLVMGYPFPHNDSFWRPWETSLLKILWEKEKLLVTSNFSISQCFLPVWIRLFKTCFIYISPEGWKERVLIICLGYSTIFTWIRKSFTHNHKVKKIVHLNPFHSFSLIQDLSSPCKIDEEIKIFYCYNWVGIHRGLYHGSEIKMFDSKVWF